MSAARMTMMTAEDIRTEFGWDDDMIHSLLKTPDSTKARRCKSTGLYAYEHYYRERVLAIAQSKEGRDAKRRWDETLGGNTPDPGWTTRLGDMGRVLGITAVAVGRILELSGYRSNKHVTDSAVAAGCGVRRWDGFAMHDDCTLKGLFPPSDRQPKTQTNRKSLMPSQQRLLNSRQGSGWRSGSVDRRRRKPHIGKRRRPW
jgi:hypothetical protein